MSTDRLSGLTSWNADWRDLRVAVLGLSMTGFSVADTLAELGAEVLVLSESAEEEYARLLPVIGAALELGSLAEVPAALVGLRPRGGHRLARLLPIALRDPLGPGVGNRDLGRTNTRLACP